MASGMSGVLTLPLTTQSIASCTKAVAARKKAGYAIFCALDAPARRGRCGRRAGSIRRAVLVEEAPLAIDEGGEQVVVGVGDFVTRRADADFQNKHVFAGFVKHLAGIAGA